MIKKRKFVYIAPPNTGKGSPLYTGFVSRLYRRPQPKIDVEKVATRFANSEAEPGTKKWQQKHIFAVRYLEDCNKQAQIASETIWAEVIAEWEDSPEPTPPYVGKTMVRIMGR